MARVYIYVVDRDFGFAPNPFHGVCTLATCKPLIRKAAMIDDWVFGVGGRRLKETGQCVFAMRVSQALSFNQYWADPDFLAKRPVRNGSRVMILGDNIYHREDQSQPWQQIDSHHSNPDGTPNAKNVKTDTGADRVLISKEFYYFGSAAPEIPKKILEALGYKNGRATRIFRLDRCTALMAWLQGHTKAANSLAGDPKDFAISAKRYSGRASVLA